MLQSGKIDRSGQVFSAAGVLANFFINLDKETSP